MNVRGALNMELMLRARLKCYIFPVLLLALLTSCGKVSSSASPNQTVTAPSSSLPSLRSLAMAHGLSIGTTVDVDALQDEGQYRDILAREFNMVTPEVSMKFDATEPQRNTYTFEEGDVLTAF